METDKNQKTTTKKQNRLKLKKISFYKNRRKKTSQGKPKTDKPQKKHIRNLRKPHDHEGENPMFT